MEWEAIRNAALARNDRFLDMIIEGMGVCPYARSSRVNGGTRRFVLPDRVTTSLPLAPSAELAEILATMSAAGELEVVQVIFPRAAVGPREWVRSVKEVTVKLQAPYDRSFVAVAAFHPALSYRTDTPSAMVPLFRRSPDPLIQWIRLSVLDRVRQGRPDGDVAMPEDASGMAALHTTFRRKSLADEIAEANFGKVHDMGVKSFERLLRESHER